MIRLGDGIFTWGVFNPDKKYNFNGFILHSSQGTLVVDPPPLSADDQAYLEKSGLWPNWIIITNRNHVRDRQWWVERRSNTLTAMHFAEVSQVDIKVDRQLKEGDRFLGGIEILHLPGKSPGEIGLYWQERGALLIGDALIGDPPGGLRLLPAAKIDDPKALKASLKKIDELSFDTLLLADGDPILRNAKLHASIFISSLP